jgi:hypothetical protein
MKPVTATHSFLQGGPFTTEREVALPAATTFLACPACGESKR